MSVLRWVAFSLLAVNAVPASAGTSYLPYLACGGGYVSTMTLYNTGAVAAQATVLLFDREGRQFDARIEFSDKNSLIAHSITLQIAAGGSASVLVRPSAEGGRTDAWAKIDSPSDAVMGMATINYQSGEGTVSGRWNLLANSSVSAAVIPVDDDASDNRATAWSVVNPGTGAVTLDSFFMAADGGFAVQLARAVLGPGELSIFSPFQDPRLPSSLRGNALLRTQENSAVAVAAFHMQAAPAGPVFATLPALVPRSTALALGTRIDGVAAISTDPRASQPALPFTVGEPGTVYLKDPYCATLTQVAVFPKEYLGEFPMPEPGTRKLPSNVIRSVALKDAWSQHPTLNRCSGSNRIRDVYRANLLRLRSLGVEDVQVTTWPYLQDRGRGPELDTSRLEIPPGDYPFIAKEAAELGLTVTLLINVAPGENTPYKPDREWYARYLDSYSDFIASQASLAEQNGFRALMLNNRDYMPDNAAYKDLFVEKMLSALERVRRNYTGKVIFNDAIFWFNPNAQEVAAEIIKRVDEINLVLHKPWTITEEEDRNLTVGLLREKYLRILTSSGAAYAKFGVPINVMLQIQSHRTAMTAGWLEDGLCVAKDGDACYQRKLPADFSVQAIAYEAALQAIEAVHEKVFRCNMVVSDGYWHSDVMLPMEGMPHLAQSVRNKPAERILIRWFQR